MDEATALLLALEATPPHAPTACADWTAHDLVAHLAAGAAEMAALIEATLAGQPERPTAGFEERERPSPPWTSVGPAQRLFVEALRLNAAVEALDRAGDGCTVAFAGRRLDPAALSLHGRSEAALHRWDLVGDDEVGRELLGQAELTAHALTVLNAMEVAEGVTTRAAVAGVEDRRLTSRHRASPMWCSSPMAPAPDSNWTSPATRPRPRPTPPPGCWPCGAGVPRRGPSTGTPTTRPAGN